MSVAVPTFRDLQSMDDREIVRLMLNKISCPRCNQGITLTPVMDSIEEVLRDETKGMRRIRVQIWCSANGCRIARPILFTLPLTEQAYNAMNFFGEKMRNFRPSQAAQQQAQQVRRRIIDPTRPWYSEADDRK